MPEERNALAVPSSNAADITSRVVIVSVEQGVNKEKLCKHLLLSSTDQAMFQSKTVQSLGFNNHLPLMDGMEKELHALLPSFEKPSTCGGSWSVLELLALKFC